jgi:hypothetical protein
VMGAVGGLAALLLVRRPAAGDGTGTGAAQNAKSQAVAVEL